MACSTSSGSSTWQDGGIQSSHDAALADAHVPIDAGAEPDARVTDGGKPAAETLRVATYNLADVRSESLADGSDAKLQRIAATIQRVGPDILFVNELAYDPAGQNAQRFADLYLGVSQGDGLVPLSYRAVMRPSASSRCRAPSSRISARSNWMIVGVPQQIRASSPSR